jgi:hypothetical protein
MSVQFGSENAHAYDESHGWGQHAILMQKLTGLPNCCFEQRSDGVHESTFASKHRRKRVATGVATGVAAVTSSVSGVCCRRRGRQRRLQKPMRSFALGLSGLYQVLWRICNGFGRRQSLCRNLECRAGVLLVLKLPCHL